jgi:hypothetical protein
VAVMLGACEVMQAATMVAMAYTANRRRNTRRIR